MSHPNEPLQSDLVDKALGSLDRVLDVVHDRVLRPILLVGRTLGYLFVLLLVALVLVSVLVIGTIRLLNVYLFVGHEWLSYVILGTISLGVGLWIWRRRRPTSLRK